MRRLPFTLTLATLALALLGVANALDAHGIAPALESAFPPSVAYLDCPYQGTARTCVLLPDATSVQSASRIALAFLRQQPDVSSIERQGNTASYHFRVGDTSYRLGVAASRARRGMFAATLSFSLPAGTAAQPVCLHPNALFDFARLPSLSGPEYASMATAITCRGPDPVDAQGRTPLTYAVASSNLAAVRTLLRGGADPNHIDNTGWTPMLVAARSGTRPILDVLLQAGGDPTYIAPDGATAASLEPFNDRLDASAMRPAGTAILPDGVGVVSPPYHAGLPIPGPDGASLAAAPAVQPATGAASSPAPAGSIATRGRGKAPALRSVTATRADAPATPRPSPIAAAHPADAPTPSRTAAPVIDPPSRRTSPVFAMLALALVLAVGLALTVVRLRRRPPLRHPLSLTDTSTSLQAVPQPRPFLRGPRRHSLEPAPHWNDPRG